VWLSKAATAGLIVVALSGMAGTGFVAVTPSAYADGVATAGTLGPLMPVPTPT
jgi:hypothetical protein